MDFFMEWVCEAPGERRRVAGDVVPALKDRSNREEIPRTLKMSQIGGRYFRCEISVFCLKAGLRTTGGTTKNFVPDAAKSLHPGFFVLQEKHRTRNAHV